MSQIPPKLGEQVVKIAIDADLSGQRLDNFLLARLKGLPKSRLYRLLRKGEVRINGKRVKPSQRLQVGDEVRVPPIRLGASAPLPEVKQGLADRLVNSVIYEDPDVIVLNKPAGMAVHGGSGIHLGLIEAFRQIRPECKQLELVHRLDRDTSGCLVLAKKRSALTTIHAQQHSGGMQKQYLAIVEGQWPKHLDEIRAPLHKYNLGSGERMVKVAKEGKAAHTLFSRQSSGDSASLIVATLVTGRTHQIRVHTQFAGHPIVGDTKYGGSRKNHPHLCLHAHKLKLLLPSGKRINLIAELPKEFMRAAKEWGIDV